MAVNSDHVHLFIKYTPKYSVSYISKMIKGRSSRMLRKEFPHLKKCVVTICGLRVVTTVLWALGGTWLRSIFPRIIHINIIGNNSKTLYRPGTICTGYTVTYAQLAK